MCPTGRWVPGVCPGRQGAVCLSVMGIRVPPVCLSRVSDLLLWVLGVSHLPRAGGCQVSVHPGHAGPCPACPSRLPGSPILAHPMPQGDAGASSRIPGLCMLAPDPREGPSCAWPAAGQVPEAGAGKVPAPATPTAGCIRHQEAPLALGAVHHPAATSALSYQAAVPRAAPGSRYRAAGLSSACTALAVAVPLPVVTRWRQEVLGWGRRRRDGADGGERQAGGPGRMAGRGEPVLGSGEGRRAAEAQGPHNGGAAQPARWRRLGGAVLAARGKLSAHARPAAPKGACARHPAPRAAGPRGRFHEAAPGGERRGTPVRTRSAARWQEGRRA